MGGVGAAPSGRGLQWKYMWSLSTHEVDPALLTPKSQAFSYKLTDLSNATLSQALHRRTKGGEAVTLTSFSGWGHPGTPPTPATS